MIYFETKYKRGGRMCVYQTKTLTDTHQRIRDKYKPATTCKCDTSIKWAFGVWAEVIASSKDDI